MRDRWRARSRERQWEGRSRRWIESVLPQCLDFPSLEASSASCRPCQAFSHADHLCHIRSPVPLLPFMDASAIWERGLFPNQVVVIWDLQRYILSSRVSSVIECHELALLFFNSQANVPSAWSVRMFASSSSCLYEDAMAMQE